MADASSMTGETRDRADFAHTAFRTLRHSLLLAFICVAPGGLRLLLREKFRTVAASDPWLVVRNDAGLVLCVIVAVYIISAALRNFRQARCDLGRGPGP